MKFFHLSDLHLGKHLHHYNLKEDQAHILREVIDYAAKLRPDAIVIAGDIYDKSVPSAEAVSVFDSFLTGLADLKPAIPVLIIAGNHDSGERLDYAREILGRHEIYIAGKPPMRPEEHIRKITFSDEWGPVHVYMLPFFKPSYVRGLLPDGDAADYTAAMKLLLEREAPDYEERNVLITHQFFTGNGQSPDICDSELHNVGGLDNVDISAVSGFDYVALGHIHGPQRVGAEHIRYCGTLLKYSVSEAAHRKSLTVVTLGEKGSAPLIEEFPLHPLRDVVRMEGSLWDMLERGREGASDFYASVTLTDEAELYKPREQLEAVYPYLLEVRLDNERVRSRLAEAQEIEIRSPLEMFGDFYREMRGTDLGEEGSRALLEILETMGEVEE